MLLQIHGQHDTQSLFSAEAQLHILDEYGELSGELEGYSLLYKKYISQKENWNIRL